MCGNVLNYARAALSALLLTAAGCSVYDEKLLDPRQMRMSTLAADGGAQSPAPMSVAAAGSSAPDASAAAVRESGAPDLPTAACSSEQVDDYCRRLPALPRPARIDGNLDCGLQLVPLAPKGWKGATPEPTTRAQYAAAFRPDGLYLYVEVHGSQVAPHAAGQPIFCGDAVEFYVDADASSDVTGSYDMSGTMQFVVAANVTGQLDAWRFVAGNPQGAWISKAVQVTALRDGYAVEAFIAASDLGLWAWMPSARVSFDIGIDEPGVPDATSPRCGMQLGQYFLSVGDAAAASSCHAEPWCDVRAFCAASSAG